MGRALHPDTFADRAAASLDDDRVAAFVADRLTDAILAQDRDLTAYRALLVTAVRSVVTSNAFRGVARSAVRQAYGALFSGVGRSVVLSADDLDTVLRAALAATPEIAQALPATVTMGGVSRLGSNPLVRAARLIIRLNALLPRAGLLALLVGALFFALGGWLMLDHRKALVGAGVALLVVGIGLWGLVPLGETAITRLVSDRSAAGALAGLWSVGVEGLRGWGLAFVAAGVVLAAAGSSLLERLDVAAIGRRAWQTVFVRPRKPSLRLARALGFVVAGMLAVAAPRATIAALTALAGITVVFIGLHELFAVVLRATPAHARVGRAVATNGEGWAVGGVLVVVLAAAFAAVIALTARPEIATRAPTSIDSCNGTRILCDRRLDEVMLPGTHNAMASADRPGWMFPQQERGIVTQLEDGIRALLIDVHYGTPAIDRVRTDFSDSATLATAERALGPEGTAAAMRIRDRMVGEAEGERGLYTCHGFCELGAAPLGSALRAIHEFLVLHPDAVIVIEIEDHVTPLDMARAFQASELSEFVYHGRPDSERGFRWPTLREMIARDERAVVLLESGRGGVSWLLPAFRVIQETPYDFARVGDTLSCAPNRGGTSGSLFQLNHWITTTPAALPSNAAVINSRATLLERVHRCTRERGQRPNIIAVDFYRTGDLLDVVRELNAGPQPSLGTLTTTERW